MDISPFTIEEAEEFLIERMQLSEAKVMDEKELSERLLNSYSELKSVTKEDLSLVGSFSVFVLLKNLLMEKDISEKYLDIWRKRIACGYKDIDFGIQKIYWKNLMVNDLKWSSEEVKQHKGVLPISKVFIDIVDRNEYEHFKLREISLNGVIFKVMTTEESFLRLLFTVVDNLIPEYKPKWFFDIRFLKTYIQLEKDLEEEDLEKYLSSQFDLFVKDRKFYNMNEIINISETSGISLKEAFVKYVSMQTGREMGEEEVLNSLIEKYNAYGVDNSLIKELFFSKRKMVLWRNSTM